MSAALTAVAWLSNLNWLFKSSRAAVTQDHVSAAASYDQPTAIPQEVVDRYVS